MQILCLQVHDAMASQGFDADVPAELVLLQPCGRGRLDWPNTLLLGVTGLANWWGLKCQCSCH